MFGRQRNTFAPKENVITLQKVLEEVRKTNMEYTVRTLKNVTILQVFGPNQVLEFKFKAVA